MHNARVNYQEVLRLNVTRPWLGVVTRKSYHSLASQLRRIIRVGCPLLLMLVLGCGQKDYRRLKIDGTNCLFRVRIEFSIQCQGIPVLLTKAQSEEMIGHSVYLLPENIAFSKLQFSLFQTLSGLNILTAEGKVTPDESCTPGRKRVFLAFSNITNMPFLSGCTVVTERPIPWFTNDLCIAEFTVQKDQGELRLSLDGN
jgi:hypothetical protein